MILNPPIVTYKDDISEKIVLSPRQISIINEIEERGSYINLIRSPANVGKTFLSCVYFALNTVFNTNVNETSFIVTYDARSFQNNIAPLLQKIYHHLGEKHVKLSDRTTSIQLSNGSTLSYISSCSSDPEAKTRGTNLSFVLIDELSKINDGLFYALVSRLRNNPKRKLIATTNADSMLSGGDYNWCYKVFFQNDAYKKMNKKHIHVVRLTKADAFVTSEVMSDYHELMKSILPKHLLSNFIDDSFSMPSDLVYFEAVKPSNGVYIHSSHDGLKELLSRDDSEYIMGVDFGYGHKTGITLGVKGKGRCYIIESIGREKLTTGDIFKLICNMLDKYNIKSDKLLVACDPSSPAMIDELCRLGLMASQGCNKFEKGVTIVNSLFRSGKLKIVRRTNEDLIQEINGYTNKMRNLKRLDDVCDSMRYMVASHLEDIYSNIDMDVAQRMFERFIR